MRDQAGSVVPHWVRDCRGKGGEIDGYRGDAKLADDALRHGVTILYPSRTFAMLLGREVGTTPMA